MQSKGRLFAIAEYTISLSKTKHHYEIRSIIARDGFRESIIRLGVKIDNGLEKLNQGLKKAEKVKNSD